MPKILVSDRAQMVMSYHKNFDAYEEERLGGKSFGSTKSGIAPFYSDKYAKIGFQVSELFDDDLLKEKVVRVAEQKNVLLEHLYHKPLINPDDLYKELQEYKVDTRMNLEMAVTEEMLAIAVETKPHFCCLVPEKRQEVTTEGGLDVAGQREKMRDACKRLADAGIQVSLFIDADEEQIKAAAEVGAPFIEIHTGCYADAKTDAEQAQELARIAKAATFATSLGLKVNAGHGLTYHNVKAIAAIPEMHELNIGHAIIGRAVMTGLKDAVAEMKRLMLEARG